MEQRPMSATEMATLLGLDPAIVADNIRAGRLIPRIARERARRPEKLLDVVLTGKSKRGRDRSLSLTPDDMLVFMIAYDLSVMMLRHVAGEIAERAVEQYMQEGENAFRLDLVPEKLSLLIDVAAYIKRRDELLASRLQLKKPQKITQDVVSANVN